MKSATRFRRFYRIGTPKQSAAETYLQSLDHHRGLEGIIKVDEAEK